MSSMWTLSTFGLFLSASLAFGTPHRGNQGGSTVPVEATPHEFPFIVSIRYAQNQCAGTIINEHWVATSSNCSQYYRGDYTLVAADHNINIVQGTEQTRRPVRFVNAPDLTYGQYGVPMANTIALVKADRPFEFNEYVKPVTLPSHDAAPPSIAMVAGWSGSSTLRKEGAAQVAHSTCKNTYNPLKYEYLRMEVGNKMVCYGEAGMGSHVGDVGAPLIGGDNNEWVGTVGWGYGTSETDSATVSEDYPGVYIETSKYVEWIEEVTTYHAEDLLPSNTTLLKCGGHNEASSGILSMLTLTAGENCLWTIQVPLDSARFVLTASTLQSEDSLKVVRFKNGQLSSETQISEIRKSYSVPGGGILLALSISPNIPTPRSFVLEFYSSGFKTLPNLAPLTTPTGNFSYPWSSNGRFTNNENGLLLVAPEGGENKPRRISFSNFYVDRLDAINIFNWENGRFSHVTRLAGYGNPSPVTLQGGKGVVTFNATGIYHTQFYLTYA